MKLLILIFTFLTINYEYSFAAAAAASSLSSGIDEESGSPNSKKALLAVTSITIDITKLEDKLKEEEFQTQVNQALTITLDCIFPGGKGYMHTRAFDSTIEGKISHNLSNLVKMMTNIEDIRFSDKLSLSPYGERFKTIIIRSLPEIKMLKSFNSTRLRNEDYFRFMGIFPYTTIENLTTTRRGFALLSGGLESPPYAYPPKFKSLTVMGDGGVELLRDYRCPELTISGKIHCVGHFFSYLPRTNLTYLRVGSLPYPESDWIEDLLFFLSLSKIECFEIDNLLHMYKGRYSERSHPVSESIISRIACITENNKSKKASRPDILNLSLGAEADHVSLHTASVPAVPVAASGAGGGTSSYSSESLSEGLVVKPSEEVLSRLSASEKDQLILYLLRQQQVQQNMLSEFIKETRSTVRGLLEVTAGIRDQQLKGFEKTADLWEGIRFPRYVDFSIDSRIKEQQALLDEIMGRFDEDEEEDSVDEEVQVRGGGDASAVAAAASSASSKPHLSPKLGPSPAFLDIPGLYNMRDDKGRHLFRLSITNGLTTTYKLSGKDTWDETRLLAAVHRGFSGDSRLPIDPKEYFWNHAEIFHYATGDEIIGDFEKYPHPWDAPKETPGIIFSRDGGPEILICLRGTVGDMFSPSKDWLTNLSFASKNPVLYIKDSSKTASMRKFFAGLEKEKSGFMHHGFLRAAMSAAEDIGNLIEKHQRANGLTPATTKLIVSGHSLGGGVGYSLAPTLLQKLLLDAGLSNPGMNYHSYLGVGAPRAYSKTVRRIMNEALGRTNLVNIATRQRNLKDTGLIAARFGLGIVHSIFGGTPTDLSMDQVTEIPYWDYVPVNTHRIEVDQRPGEERIHGMPDYTEGILWDGNMVLRLS